MYPYLGSPLPEESQDICRKFPGQTQLSPWTSLNSHSSNGRLVSDAETGSMLDMLPHHGHRVWIGLHRACAGSGYMGVFEGLGLCAKYSHSIYILDSLMYL
jgi:hypothetical protein